MSKLGKFLGNSAEVDIKGEKLTIYPLKVKDMEFFDRKENASKEEEVAISKKILKMSLRNPDLDDKKIVLTDEERKVLEEEIPNDEEIGSLPLEVFTKIMEEINKLNGFNNEDIESLRLAKKRMQGAKQ